MSTEFEIESPCVSQCGMDMENKICTGCGRTLDEIRAWKLASNDEKLEILSAMARRRAEAAG
ncbi:MAG: DUF1289 domain-containing protein [Bacteroidales bacterium]